MALSESQKKPDKKWELILIDSYWSDSEIWTEHGNGCQNKTIIKTEGSAVSDQGSLLYFHTFFCPRIYFDHDRHNCPLCSPAFIMYLLWRYLYVNKSFLHCRTWHRFRLLTPVSLYAIISGISRSFKKLLQKILNKQWKTAKKIFLFFSKKCWHFSNPLL